MTSLTPTQIADAVFLTGKWNTGRAGDHSLRRGFQILTGQLGFPQRKVPLHYQALRQAGLVMLAQKFNAFAVEGEFADIPAGTIVPEKMPKVEFDIEHPSGFRAICEDRLDQLMLQARIDENDFRGALQKAYLASLRLAKPEQFEIFGLAPEPEKPEFAGK